VVKTEKGPKRTLVTRLMQKKGAGTDMCFISEPNAVQNPLSQAVEKGMGGRLDPLEGEMRELHDPKGPW